MLQIREPQMELFRKQARLTFEREMASYLKRYFPFEAANADLERWVRTGLQKAAVYGFGTYYESAMYLALTAMLGIGFDEDPQIPWAVESITSPQEPSEDRITRVYDKGIEYLDATGGPKCLWFVRAKIRFRKQGMTALDQGVPPQGLPGRIRQVLLQMYPEKAAVIGERAVKQLVKSAIERTGERGAKSPHSALIHATHMYYLGSEFDRDPCFPWVETTLADTAAGSVDDRYSGMHQLSLDYLERSFRFKG
jgi:hypothetical protein